MECARHFALGIYVCLDEVFKRNLRHRKSVVSLAQYHRPVVTTAVYSASVVENDTFYSAHISYIYLL